MSTYQANTRDIKFAIWEQIGADSLFALDRYKDFDRSTFDMVIDEAAKFAEKELGPANAEGDRVGCRFNNGKVSAPPHFHDIYKRFCGAGPCV